MVNTNPIDHPDVAEYAYYKITKLTSQPRVSSWLVSEIINFSIMFVRLSESKNDNDHECLVALCKFIESSLRIRKSGALISFGSSGINERKCNGGNCKCLYNECESCYFEFDESQKYIITKRVGVTFNPSLSFHSKQGLIYGGVDHPLVNMIDDTCDTLVGELEWSNCINAKSVCEIYRHLNRHRTKNGFHSNLMLWYIAIVEEIYNADDVERRLYNLADHFSDAGDSESQKKIKAYRSKWLRRRDKNSTDSRKYTSIDWVKDTLMPECCAIFSEIAQ